MESFTDTQKDAITKEIKDQFNQLISAINRLDAIAWSEFYSMDAFVSAIAGTDCYAGRNGWVETVKTYFSARESQNVLPFEVRVTPLAPDLALMTSEEKGEMSLKSGETVKSDHVFTMIWKKERNVWKILHSHESWLDGK